MRWFGRAIWVIFLTLLSQLGGLAWLLALPFRRRWLAFALFYIGLSAAALFVAPLGGRQALPCFGETLRSANPLYCALNRHYVTPELADLAQDLADEMARRHPGTITLTLDASFPFVTGMPLLPHLSHDDGEKLDLAFYYRDEAGYAPGELRSPIGYWAFEDGPTDCPEQSLSLRWNLPWLQPLWRDLQLDDTRTRAALSILAQDPRIDRIFVEPHLQHSFALQSPRIRFQGCRAARHDDHIHLQLR